MYLHSSYDFVEEDEDHDDPTPSAIARGVGSNFLLERECYLNVYCSPTISSWVLISPPLIGLCKFPPEIAVLLSNSPRSLLQTYQYNQLR